MTYREAPATVFQCGRGHPYRGASKTPTAWYCTQAECGCWSGVFDGPEGEIRRVRAVLSEAPVGGAPNPSHRAEGREERDAR